ncbi:MAG TPA: hypothetical protein PKN28_02445 [Clostridiales bacterium]|nr:hypothetical protein [Clostridiales bacterium]
MSSAHKKIMLRKVKNTDMTLNEALQESTKVVDEFKKYNEILSSVLGCIFAYSGGFGWSLHGGRSQKGFSTPEEAYLDCCREIEGA